MALPIDVGEGVVKKNIRIREREISVEDVEQTMAVRVEMEDVRSDTTHSELLSSMAERAWDLRRDDLPVPPQQLAPFVRAGWTFVEPHADAISAVRSGARSGPLEAANAQRVLRIQETGEIVIGTPRIVVQVDEELSDNGVAEVLGKHDLRVLRRLRFGRGLYQAELSASRDSLELVEEVGADASVQRAEPELIEHIPARLTPNDPYYSRQWQHENGGRDLRSESAWDVTRGAGVRIAVVDNGFDVMHPDLAPSLDSRSGYYVEDPTGDATFRQTAVGFPRGRHGTFCAGMAGARGQNAEGVCGVAFEASLMLVACMVDQVASQVTLARAIAYAAEPSTELLDADPGTGAQAISCSLGPNGAHWILKTELEEAIRFVTHDARDGRGVPLLWAATNGDYEIRHDEVCSHPDVIAVSRMRRDDLHDGAGHGAGLEFLAPGVDVYSTTQGGYAYGTGCSYAAPAAAGVAGLVLSLDNDLPASDVREILQNTCRKVGSVTYDKNGWHERYGFGCVNADAAVQRVP